MPIRLVLDKCPTSFTQFQGIVLPDLSFIMLEFVPKQCQEYERTVSATYLNLERNCSSDTVQTAIISSETERSK